MRRFNGFGKDARTDTLDLFPCGNFRLGRTRIYILYYYYYLRKVGVCCIYIKQLLLHELKTLKWVFFERTLKAFDAE